MLPYPKRRYDLPPVKAVASGNQNSANIRMAQDFVFIGGTILEFELLCRVFGMGPCCCADSGEFNPANLLDRRQKHPGGKSSRADHAQTNRARGGMKSAGTIWLIENCASFNKICSCDREKGCP